MADFVALRTAFESHSLDTAKCMELLTRLKLAFVSKTSYSHEEEVVWIETLEMASLISVRSNDFPAFERHASQVKSYYYSPQRTAQLSDRSCAIIGLYLLYLLVCDRIGDFHIELELIPTSLLAHNFIAYPIILEKAMMEGNYAKVYKASNEPVPLPEFKIFLSPLATAVQSKAAESLQAGSGSNTVSPLTTEAEAIDAIGKLLSYAADLERIV